VAVDSYRTQIMVEFDADVGEGPVWIAERELLAWVDITEGNWHRTDLRSGRTRTVHIPTMLGAVTPAVDGGWVAAVSEGFFAIDDDGAIMRRLDELPEPDLRMNDAKCDSSGRFWSGSNELDFDPGKGRMHRLGADWSSDVVLTGLTLPNGLGFSPDDRVFYLIDSLTRQLFAFDYDLDDGAISSQRVLIEWPSGLIPDGACVDEEGCIWVAFWGDGAVRRYSPRGELVGAVHCLLSQPSSCAFIDGGRLVITTARRGMAGDRLEAEPLAGSLLVAEVGVGGAPIARFAGSTSHDPS